MIQKHNAYKSTNKREYSSDYKVILRYVAERVKGDKEKELAEGGLKTRYAGMYGCRPPNTPGSAATTRKA